MTAPSPLSNLDADLERVGGDLWIARANGPLRELLTVTGLTKRPGTVHIFTFRARSGNGVSGAIGRRVVVSPVKRFPGRAEASP